jgi:transposase-like protein
VSTKPGQLHVRIGCLADSGPFGPQGLHSSLDRRVAGTSGEEGLDGSPEEASVYAGGQAAHLEEARQPGTTVAEVLRRHQVDATTVYRWEQQAKDAVREAMGRDRRRSESGMKDREIERLRAELAKKSRIIAESIEENLELERGRVHREAMNRQGAGSQYDQPERCNLPQTAGCPEDSEALQA